MDNVKEENTKAINRESPKHGGITKHNRAGCIWDNQSKKKKLARQ